MKKTRIIALFILVVNSRASFSQEQPGKLQRANALFEQLEYYKSAAIYLELANRKLPDPLVLARLATCYRMMNEYTEAERWYAKLAASPGAGHDYLEDYADVLLTNQEFAEAKEQFRKYYGANKKDLDRQLARCDSALRWSSLPPGYTVENDSLLNSGASDWGTVFYKGAVVFTSDRIPAEAVEEERYHWTNNGFLTLYTQLAPKGKITPFNFGALPAIHAKQHLGPVAFTASGDTAYLTVSTALPQKMLVPGWSGSSGRQLYTRRLELLTSVRQNGKWTAFQRFPYDNANSWSLGQAALSADGTVLYFTSDMPGGQGKTDIWYCQKLPNGTWGKPVNCGKTINTKEEEAFPTTGNGKLYFSSKGLPGMGGYDLFETSGSKSSWSLPANLKYPLNSTYDDFWLLTSNNTVSGYFSSNRAGGKGNDDLYQFKQLAVNREITPAVQTATPLAGSFPAAASLQPGKTFVLNTIYYDLDKWNIRPDAALELDKLVQVLEERPLLKIELSSHTDSRAPDEYNLKLSQRRAEAAVNYLVAHGISRDRLLARGYGETRLVNRCANGVECTEAEHQANRRTEIKVLGN